jgi:hypothetical protein
VQFPLITCSAIGIGGVVAHRPPPPARARLSGRASEFATHELDSSKVIFDPVRRTHEKRGACLRLPFLFFGVWVLKDKAEAEL